MTFEEMCSATVGQLWDELEKQRRLVEEARADAKSWMERSVAIQKQEDEVEDERDRLKGELAEARRDLEWTSDEAGRLRGQRDRGIELLRRADIGTLLPRALRDNIKDYSADISGATPLRYCHVCRLVLPTFWSWSVHSDCMDGGDAPPEQLAATPAEQAQGEAVPVGVAIAALAKRVDAMEALTAHLGQSGALQSDVVTLQNKVAVLERKLADVEDYDPDFIPALPEPGSAGEGK